MKKTSRRGFAAMMISGFLICFMAMGFDSVAGLDYYEIFLNKQLVMKRAMNQPLADQAVSLNTAGANDQLVINYYQCHSNDGLGKGRTIVLKDSKGAVVKEWQFADGNAENKTMVISMKELTQLGKGYEDGSLSLFYASKETAPLKMMTIKFN